jgi:hypothetical protein
MNGIRRIKEFHFPFAIFDLSFVIAAPGNSGDGK